MTSDIALVLGILTVSVAFLITEWIPMEVVALLVMGAVALTDLVSPAEALAGFSNPAVVTVWAVFVLSGGLTRTGVANIIGRQIMRLIGRSETIMVVVIMVSAGVMSAFMNNVAVAALLLPVVMDIARQTGTPPSQLLLPLAYGSLLGGLTTQIGTPPNILVSEALRENGLKPFSLFDFTPVGLTVMVIGIAFVALIGRRMLPARDVKEEIASSMSRDLNQQYQLQERLFFVRVPADSVLVNRTLAESRIGSALGLNVVGITRGDRTLLAPQASDTLRASDRLIVEGHKSQLEDLNNWQRLVVEEERLSIDDLSTGDLEVAEIRLAPDSPLCGSTLSEIDFRNRFQAMVLAIRRDGTLQRTNLQDKPLASGDWLLVQGSPEQLAFLKENPGLEQYQPVSKTDLTSRYQLHERLLALSVPPDSILIGKSLAASRLGDALGLRVLGIKRRDGTVRLPSPDEVLRANDQLVVEGRREDLDILRGLARLEIDRRALPDIQSDTVGLVEMILSPHTTLAGKTLRQLHFREKYGLTVLAIWRQGRVHFENLRDMALNFGDAMLLHGQRSNLRVLGREPDFIVLTESAQELPRLDKAKISTLIMASVMIPVILGWVPIYIATVVGAALMVLTRCLTMEEAYRFIEWKAVFLIAGMLPLGTALDKTGAAKFLAEGVVGSVGGFGPIAVMAALLVLTFLATCFVPTAALVVLMAPIALKTCADLGLSPYALMMTIAMAASASFTTPVAHPANILVMGPGGYRFTDYLKVGGLLTLVVLVVLLVILPLFWPLKP